MALLVPPCLIVLYLLLARLFSSFCLTACMPASPELPGITDSFELLHQRPYALFFLAFPLVKQELIVVNAGADALFSIK